MHGDMATQGWTRGRRGRDVGTWAGTRDDADTEGWDGDQGKMWGCGEGKRIVSEKKVKEEKKTYGCDTEEGDVDADAGSTQQVEAGAGRARAPRNECE